MFFHKSQNNEVPATIWGGTTYGNDHQVLTYFWPNSVFLLYVEKIDRLNWSSVHLVNTYAKCQSDLHTSRPCVLKVTLNLAVIFHYTKHWSNCMSASQDHFLRLIDSATFPLGLGFFFLVNCAQIVKAKCIN